MKKQLMNRAHGWAARFSGTMGVQKRQPREEFSFWSLCGTACSSCTTRGHRRNSSLQAFSFWSLHRAACPLFTTRGQRKDCCHQAFSLRSPHGLAACPWFNTTGHRQLPSGIQLLVPTRGCFCFVLHKRAQKRQLPSGIQP